jgi:hypothetical protein
MRRPILIWSLESEQHSNLRYDDDDVSRYPQYWPYEDITHITINVPGHFYTEVASNTLIGIVGAHLQNYMVSQPSPPWEPQTSCLYVTSIRLQGVITERWKVRNLFKPTAMSVNILHYKREFIHCKVPACRRLCWIENCVRTNHTITIPIHLHLKMGKESSYININRPSMWGPTISSTWERGKKERKKKGNAIAVTERGGP